MEGWIKLWRKSLESGLLQNPHVWTFWTWCLLKASHRHHRQMVGWQTVDLEPGQFVFGRDKAAHELNMSSQTVRTCVDKLRRMGNITTKATNKFTIISIVNWEAYQQEGQEANQQANQQHNQHVTSSQPAANHRQECKKGKNEERGTPPERFLTTARNYYSYLQSKFPNRKIQSGNGKAAKGAEALRKLEEIDGFSLEQDVKPALKWALEDDFWQDKVLSLAELRKKKPGNENHKFFNLYQRYMAENEKKEEDDEVAL